MIEIPYPVGPEYRVALFKPPRASWTDSDPNPLDALEITARRFCYRGAKREAAMVFEEVEDVNAARPTNEAVVPFTTGEWADACARWSRISAQTPQLHQMDMEFLNRHDGGEIVVHKSGVLIGAFYIAPSWSNSNDSVQIFTALRAIMEAEGE